MNKIRLITEAFSMEPRRHEVHNLYWNDDNLERIELERVTIGTECGNPVEKLMYVGYDDKNIQLFRYLAIAVNVEYFEET